MAAGTFIKRHAVKPKFWPAFRAIGIGTATALLYLYLFRTSYSWLSVHFTGGGDYRVYLKLLWALVFTFAFDQNFKRIGLKFTRRDAIVGGYCVPIFSILVCCEMVGFYLGWNPALVLHYFCVAVAEEIFFWGCLVARFRSTGMLGSTILSSIFFASFHFSDLWLGNFSSVDAFGFIETFSSAILSAGIRFYADSLFPCILLHFLLDYLNDFSTTHWIFSNRQVTFHEMVAVQIFFTSICLLEGGILLILAKRRSRHDSSNDSATSPPVSDPRARLEHVS